MIMKDEIVAPHTGAWIETKTMMELRPSSIRRSPYGSVD